MKYVLFTLLLMTTFASIAMQSSSHQIVKQQSGLALLTAIKDGNLTRVKNILLLGADVNFKDENGISALMWAVNRGNLNIVDHLISSGALIDDRSNIGSTPLMFATEAGHLRIVKRLIELEAKVNAGNALQYTVAKDAKGDNFKNIFLLLIKECADINAQTPNGDTVLHLAIQNKHSDRVDYLLELDTLQIDKQNMQRQTALMLAAMEGELEVVKALLSLGANTTLRDYGQRTAFLYAIAGNKLNIVNEFISRNFYMGDKDSFNRTALMHAIVCKHEEIAQRLIDLGAADYDIRDNEGRSYLHNAVINGLLNIIKRLLLKKTDLNGKIDSAYIDSKDNTGATPLMFAQDPQIIEILLEKGASIEHLDQSGNSALFYSLKNPLCVQKLIEAGADITLRLRDTSSLLMSACLLGNLRVVQILVEGLENNLKIKYKNFSDSYKKTKDELIQEINYKSAFGQTALMIATKAHKPEVVNYLLDKHADVTIQDNNDRNVVMQASQYLADAPNNTMHSIYGLLSSCTQAALSGYLQNPSLFYEYIEKYFEKNIFRRTCVLNDNDNRSNPNIADQIDHSNCYHQTVLMWAAMFGHKDIVERILNYFAIRVTQLEQEIAALIAFSEKRVIKEQELQKFLDTKSKFINAQDIAGRTALMYAIIYNHIEIATQLISVSGPGLYRKDKFVNARRKLGTSALGYAAARRNKTLMHAILYSLPKSKWDLEDIAEIIKNACDRGDYPIAATLLMDCKAKLDGSDYDRMF